MKRYGFGVDLGGTTCKLGLFETDGTLVEKWEIPTDTSEGGKAILPDIAAAISRKATELKLGPEDVQGIGIGVPGAVNGEGVVNRCVNLGWGVVDVRSTLSDLTGFPVQVGNDANIAALGEAWMGAGKGYSSIVMVTLGTGVGGGIILNGKIWNGFDGAAGEMGHIRVNPQETVACSCGNKGCLEQYASATGVVRVAKLRLAKAGLTNIWVPGKEGQPGILREMKEDLTAKDVFDSAKAGVPIAAEIVKEVCTLLGSAIATVCNVVNPEAVLIGGGVSKAGLILISSLEEGFHQSVFHACRNTKILLATLGNDAGIYGGVKMVLD